MAPTDPCQGDIALISVIVPNYNHATYLPKRIDSILAQTQDDFELLILDDCSTDGSRDVISRYAGDPRIRLDFNELNSGGPYLQWQKGLAMTRGEYVWIAESDDFAEPTFLEQLSAKLELDSEIGLAFCESTVVDEEGRSLGPYFERWRATAHSDYDLDVFDSEFVMSGRDYLSTFMLPWNTIPNASAVLFRRSALELVGGPVTSMRICGDWLTYCKILAEKKVVHVPERLNYFRTHQMNVRSSTRTDTFAAELLVVGQWAEETIGPLSSRKRHQLYQFSAQMLLAIERRPTDNRIPVGRVPAVFLRAAKLNLHLLPATFVAIVRQVLGGTVRAFGFRSPKPIKS